MDPNRFDKLGIQAPSLEELISTFGLGTPPSFEALISGGSEDEEDIREISETFFKKKWTEIGGCQLMEPVESPYSLSPSGFRYYFPAFIYQSTQDIALVETLISSLLYLLSDTDNPKWRQWRAARWSQFSRLQFDRIERWVMWITNCHKDRFSTEQTAAAQEGIKFWRQYLK